MYSPNILHCSDKLGEPPPYHQGILGCTFCYLDLIDSGVLTTTIVMVIIIHLMCSDYSFNKLENQTKTIMALDIELNTH